MAYKGKTTCRILKDIRRQIAEANDIDLVIKECTYQGDCAGTCPRCEAEVAYLERELARREAMGKVVRITGLAAASFAMAACSLKPKQQTINPEEEDFLYEGDIASAMCGEIAPVQEEADTNWMAGGKPLDPKYTEANESTPYKKSTSKSACQNKEEDIFVEEITEGDAELLTEEYLPPEIPTAGEIELEEEEVFVVAETMPSFPGGQDSLFQFLAANVKYPSEIQGEAHIECRVIVQFVVSKTGEIVDVEVVRSSGYEAFDREAVRVAKSMPKWNPGKQRGTPVNVKYTIVINFKLAD